MGSHVISLVLENNEGWIYYAVILTLENMLSFNLNSGSILR